MRFLLKALTHLIRLPLAALPPADPPDDTTAQNGIVYFQVFQYPGPPKKAVTEWFAAQGYPAEKALTGGGGGGGYATERAFGEGAGYGMGGKTADGVALGMGGGGGSMGLPLFKSDRLRISPMIGIGGGTIAIGTPQDEEEKPIFALINIEVGLGIDIIIPVRQMKTLIALRFGYRYVKVCHDDAPNLNGPFLRIMAGMKY